MKESTLSWLKALPYLLGAMMFLIGAARFLAHDDAIGAVIFGLTAILAISFAAAKLPRKTTM